MICRSQTIIFSSHHNMTLRVLQPKKIPFLKNYYTIIDFRPTSFLEIF